jgi:hypothetical protein
MSGQGSWSNDQLSSLTLPEGATSGARIVLDGTRDVILIYNAAGTLVGSWAASAGTDSLGNAFPANILVGAAGSPNVHIDVLGGEGIVFFPSGAPGETNAAALQVVQPDPVNQNTDLVLKSAQMTPGDYVALNATSSSSNGVDATNLSGDYVDTAATPHRFLTLTLAGTAITGSVTAVTPGTGTSRANVATAETWHAAAPLLAANWTVTGVANAPLRYRMEGTAGGVVRLDGEVITTGAGPWPTNGQIFILPTSYHPAFRHDFVTRSDIVVTAGQDTCAVFTTGAVINGQPFTAAGQRLYFDGVTFPLD